MAEEIAPVQEENYFFLCLIVYYTLCNNRLDGAYPCFVALWLQDLFIQILTSARNTSQKKKSSVFHGMLMLVSLVKLINYNCN